MAELTQGIIQIIPVSIRQGLKRIAFYGHRYHCPICERSARRYRDYGVEMYRPNARCPFCNSLERHRMLWRYLESKTNFFSATGRRILHVAAEPCFEPRFRHRFGANYLTADLLLPADVKMDITDIQYPDDTFDVVFCSHVLEHVPDDRRAMHEFHRVLKPGGWAIFMVPVTANETVEDPTVKDPQERLRLFGQVDHVRRYGPDFIDRLRAARFSVTAIGPEDFLSNKEIERLVTPRKYAGEIFHCAKDPTD